MNTDIDLFLKAANNKDYEYMDSYIYKHIGENEFLNKDIFNELEKIAAKNADFYLKNKTEKLAIYQELAINSLNGNEEKVQQIIDDYTIDCNIANVIAYKAGKKDKFEIVKIFMNEGIDLDFNDNAFIELCAQKGRGDLIGFILLDYDKKSKRPKNIINIPYINGNEIAEIESESESAAEFEIFDPTLMDVIFEKTSLYEWIIKNNMYSDLERLFSYQRQYSDYITDNIDYSKLILLSIQENKFRFFNFIIQNNKDPYFNAFPSLKNDLNLIKKIGVTLSKNNSIEESFLECALENNIQVASYLSFNKDFYNIKNEIIDGALEIAIKNNHDILAKKIIHIVYNDNYIKNNKIIIDFIDKNKEKFKNINNVSYEKEKGQIIIKI